jgi:hypothetical protein
MRWGLSFLPRRKVEDTQVASPGSLFVKPLYTHDCYKPGIPRSLRHRLFRYSSHRLDTIPQSRNQLLATWPAFLKTQGVHLDPHLRRIQPESEDGCALSACGHFALLDIVRMHYRS